jgi:hypothetical protein
LQSITDGRGYILGIIELEDKAWVTSYILLLRWYILPVFISLIKSKEVQMIDFKKVKGEGSLTLITIIASTAAWLTHVITCISDDRWGLLIAGGIVFPVGIIHGAGIWFGAW